MLSAGESLVPRRSPRWQSYIEISNFLRQQSRPLSKAPAYSTIFVPIRYQSGNWKLNKSIRRYSSHVATFKSSFNFPQASHSFKDVTPGLVGQEIVLHGYLGRQANVSKNLTFVPLLDPSLAISLQVVASNARRDHDLNPGTSKPSDHELGGSPLDVLNSLNESSPVCIRGTVRSRRPSGKAAFDGTHRIDDVEVELHEVQPLNTYPEDLVKFTKDEKASYEHRHLQIRNDTRLRHALKTRDRAASICRTVLQQNDFLEVETPLLFKSTPEGAREFIVPTREKGLAYSLPQSPQQYKQILIAGGVPHYYQIAKCFRDEDLRADRQPEFTQLDMEMAFAKGRDVMQVVETLVRRIWNDLLKVELPSDFPHMTYQNAMSEYGSDKPDRRLGLKIHRIDYLLPIDLVSKITSLTSPAVDMLVLSGFDRPRATQKFIRDFMDSKAAADAGVMTNPNGQPGIFVYDSKRPLSGLQPFGFEAAEVLEETFGLSDGDLIVIQARPDEPFSGGNTALGRIRLALHAEAVAKGILPAPDGFDFLWVEDFPMFKPNDEDPGQGGAAGFSSNHHPFTAPKTLEDIEKLENDPTLAISEHYDLVVNGVELGGGSRRIHDAKFQEYILRDILKMSDTGIDGFRHLLEALRAGCPPHAGIALGFDRLVAVLTGNKSIKDVIAFPKNSRGEDRLVKSPVKLSKAQLELYHLEVKE